MSDHSSVAFLLKVLRQEFILWPVADNRKSVFVSLVYLLLYLILAFLLRRQTWSVAPYSKSESTELSCAEVQHLLQAIKQGTQGRYHSKHQNSS